MLTRYFYDKTKTKEFSDRLKMLGENFKGKRVLLYCNKDVFNKLDETFGISKIFCIVGIVYSRYNKTSSLKTGLKIFSQNNINQTDFDVVLSAQPCPPPEVSSYVIGELEIKDKEIEYLFKEEFRDETINLDLAYNYKLDKTMPKLIKKLKGKRVVLYGAGPFLELLYKYFDFSGLNIVGIADRRFGTKERDTSREIVTETFLGYKTYAPEKITDANPDYVIITTVNYTHILEDLFFNILKNKKIKIRPLLEKPLFTLIREVWDWS